MRDVTDPEVHPFVSIIVPARNEERNIRRCVTSLLEQNYQNYEVIVVDDDSTDGTGRILDDIAQSHPHGNRLYVLRLRGLPEGWTGKPHAIHAGVQEAHGSWLLFTDADTWHAPNALPTALKKAQEEGIDLLSLGTTQELPGFWNKVMMPMAYIGISMQYPVKKINDPNSRVALANGQYILLRRTVYDITGGYARPDLRNTLLDDRDLARVVKENGFRLRFEDGRDLVRVHMYSGLTDTWHGWLKNVYLGSRGGLAFVLLELLGLPMVAIAPFLLPLISLISRKNLPRTETRLAALLELGSLLTYRAWLDRELGVPWYYAFTHPLAGTMFEGILAQSTWRILTRKGVDWRGRQYFDRENSETRNPAQDRRAVVGRG
jgi:chlorobactene glucosyltransferase